jgi:hypothetical protein
MASGVQVISNYSPLTLSNSKFSIPTFESSVIEQKIIEAFYVKENHWKQELINNRNLIDTRYSWHYVTEQLDTTLKNFAYAYIDKIKK